MIKSSKPRMQRLFRFTAPLHARQHFVHSHVDKSLREKMKIKSSSIRISKGDTVKIMSGSKKGTTGKVIDVDLKKAKIFIDSIAKKTAKGKEYHIPVSPSNVYITDLNTDDKKRIERLKITPIKQIEKPIATDNTAIAKAQKE